MYMPFYRSFGAKLASGMGVGVDRNPVTIPRKISMIRRCCKAGLAKLVYAADLKSAVARHAGSSPAPRTTITLYYLSSLLHDNPPLATFSEAGLSSPPIFILRENIRLTTAEPPVNKGLQPITPPHLRSPKSAPFPLKISRCPTLWTTRRLARWP